MGLRYLKGSVCQVVTEDQDGLESYSNLLTSGFVLYRKRVREYSDFDSWLIWAYYRYFYLRINFVKKLGEGTV